MDWAGASLYAMQQRSKGSLLLTFLSLLTCVSLTLLSILTFAPLLVSFTRSSTPLPLSPAPLPDFFSAPPPPASNFTPPVCRFASPRLLPNPSDLLSNASLRFDFVRSLLYWEAHFLQTAPCAAASCCHFEPPASAAQPAYVGLHLPTMVTMDGHRLSIPSGLPLDGGAHMFTAASKESLHVSLLALALSSTPAADLASLLLVPAGGASNAASNRRAVLDVAARQLSVKVNSYDLFDCRFPGFGGYLPWVAVADDGLTPQPGWETQVPALDNGQLIWATYGLMEVLESDAQLSAIKHIPLNSSYCPDAPTLLTSPDTTLVERWRAVMARWQANALPVFYDLKGRFRSVSHIRNTTQRSPGAANYYTDVNCNDNCYLDDPYEGELFTVYAYLQCNWTSYDDREWLWLRKRAALQPATLSVPGYRNITTQRGFWFSAHEQWKYLFLPYRDVPVNERAFVLGEKARLLWSAAQRIPGLYASINGLAVDDAAEMEYHSDCGVRQLATVEVDTDFEVTPYGAMNTMLLMHPPAQYASTASGQSEASTVDGQPDADARVETKRGKVLLNVDNVRQEALAAITDSMSSSTPDPLASSSTAPSAAAPSSSASSPNYIGLVWLAASIAHPRGQTCFGVTEGAATNGSAVSPLHTWDSSITTVLGVLGGLVNLNRQRMQREGVYARFVSVVAAEWGRVFDGVLEGDEVEWALPTASVPAVADEWSSCTDTSNVCLCGGDDGSAGKAVEKQKVAAGRWAGNARKGKRQG